MQKGDMLFRLMSQLSIVAGSESVSLYGLWSGDLFHLFGTRRQAAARGPESRTPGTRARSKANSRPGWTLSARELHEALGELSPDSLLASGAAESTLKLRVPWQQDRPLLPADAAIGRIVLRPLAVSTLAFGPADCIDLLTGIRSSALDFQGGSLAYWGQMARFVLRQLAAQQFRPDAVAREADDYHAMWRLFVVDVSDLAWLERSVQAMPPICRAQATYQQALLDPASILESFLATTTDALLRRTLASDEFFRQIPRKARELGHWELHWLSALVGRDSAICAPAKDSADGAAEIQSWIDQSMDHPVGPTPTLHFTLIEPSAEEDGPDAPWQLSFELRSPESGESLDLAQVWADGDGTRTIFGPHLSTRRRHLVSQLTRAAEVYPEIRKAITSASGTKIELTNAGAFAFLREHAPILARQGFDVRLPQWVTEAEQSLGLRLWVQPADRGGNGAEVSLGSFGLNTLLEFDWRVALGNEELTAEEFERLARQRSPLVKLRGRWIGIDHQAAAKTLEFLRGQPRRPITLAQAIRLTSGAEEFDAGLPILGLSGRAWIEQFMRESPGVEVESFDPPATFRGTLRPYQLRGLHWLAFLDRIGIGACLADDMGLGKTIQLIALLLHERAHGGRVGPTILFAPMSVVGNWERETERFAPSLKVLVHHGQQRLGGNEFVAAAESCDVVITTYGLAGRELKDFSRVAWHRIAMDEAQKIKNPTAQQTIALKSLAAVHRVALTGTPVENHLSDLWSIMDALNPGLLGSASAFRNRFVIPIEKLGDSQRAEQLRRFMRPFVLRRLKGDPAVACDLPEKMEMRVFCNLTPEQAALYERTVRTTLEQIDSASGIRRRGLILATLTRLKQVCNHPAHLLGERGPLDGRSGKCERLVEMLEEVLDEGDEALVFTQYRRMGELLKRLMEDRLSLAIPFLHGGTTMKARQRMIDEFQDPQGKARIFLLSLKAGGFGLNLTRANHVFHFDRWWNPAVEQQGADRVHRIGQTRRVQVHKFVCIGTIEERIDRLLEEKSNLAERIVGTGDEWLTGLSTAQLREYLTLSDDAVAES